MSALHNISISALIDELVRRSTACQIAVMTEDKAGRAPEAAQVEYRQHGPVGAGVWLAAGLARQAVTTARSLGMPDGRIDELILDQIDAADDPEADGHWTTMFDIAG